MEGADWNLVYVGTGSGVGAVMGIRFTLVLAGSSLTTSGLVVAGADLGLTTVDLAGTVVGLGVTRTCLGATGTEVLETIFAGGLVTDLAAVMIF